MPCFHGDSGLVLKINKVRRIVLVKSMTSSQLLLSALILTTTKGQSPIKSSFTLKRHLISPHQIILKVNGELRTNKRKTPRKLWLVSAQARARPDRLPYCMESACHVYGHDFQYFRDLLMREFY